MDEELKSRIEQAWENTREWITQFEGAPALALLLGVPETAVLPGFSAISQEAENFRVTAIPAENKNAAQFIQLDDFSAQLNLLKEGKVWELSANYAIRREAFDLDIHVVVYHLEEEKLALELSWWSDQVFSSETDNLTQFTALADYFIELQKLFSAQYLYLRPEQGGEEDWVEI